MLEGFLPFRSIRGVCDIKLTEPSLAFFVAEALGFRIGSVDIPPSAFRSCMESLFPAASFNSASCSAKRKRVAPDLVIIDYAWVTDPIRLRSTRPHLSKYWTTRRVPHLVCNVNGDGILPPPDWTIFTRGFDHFAMGGSTDGFHSVILLVPDCLASTHSDNRSVPRQPWMPLHGSLNPVTGADFAESPTPPDRVGPEVYWENGVVMPYGLFPAHDLTADVRVTCVYNTPSFWGTRRLSPVELADLYDVPLRVQEYAVANGSHLLLAEFLRATPGKTLLLGCDFLLTGCVRGGWGVATTLERAKPFELIPAKVFESDPQAEAIHKAAWNNFKEGERLEEVRKQDGQKADDATVPVALWDSMFLLTRREDTGVNQIPLVQDWRKGLELFRTGMIKAWRRIHLHSWIRSMYSRLPPDFVDNFPPSRASSWVSWRPVLGAKIRVRCSKGEWLIRQHTYDVKYEWAKGRINGRSQYQKWHKNRRSHPSLSRSLDPGRDCIRRASGATWWEWNAGSSLFFWNWPTKTHRLWAMEGQPHFELGPMPRFTAPQKKAKIPEHMEKMKEKVMKVRERLYIEGGAGDEVKSLTHMFCVPKGSSDIRMVYNGTSCGLNDVLWAPHFGLPIMQHTLRSLLPGYYQCDMDVGEMFLNFPLHPDVRPYSGVDVTYMRNDPRERDPWEMDRKNKWERWARNFMGLTDSPYRSLQLMIKAKFLAYGDRTLVDNPFRWKIVKLNLPGSATYNAKLPWVMKLREDGQLACEVYVYVDDGRITGHNKVECWKATRQFCASLQKLGIQDASRKRTEPSLMPGPWAGTVVHTETEVVATVTQVKWLKTQGLIEELKDLLQKDPEHIPHKRLEQIRGFLIYVARTYKWVDPYLKGIHQTLDGWREGYKKDGWKVPKKSNRAQVWEWELEEWLEVKEEDLPEPEDPETPEMVAAAARLSSDLTALSRLFAGDVPAVQTCRATSSLVALYMVGDASGQGLGSALWDEKLIHYQAANWAPKLGAKSSNWREARNLASRILALGKEGKLDGKELFVLTDNAVFEGTFYKGHSSNRDLHELVLDMRVMERETGCVLHIIHIAGTRMKASGIDGLSRGDFLDGMMKGEDPLQYVPLDKGAVERSGKRVEEWIRSWWKSSDGGPGLGQEDLRLMSPGDWFSTYDISEPRLWSPPPSAMETVVELFNEDRLVNPHIPHVFVLPRLMTHLWRKQLRKDADLMFEVAPGSPFWPKCMHEPLIVLIVLPIGFVPHYRGPWSLQGSGLTLELGEQLRTGFKRPEEHGREEFHDLESPVSAMWEEPEQWSGDILRQFLAEQERFPPVSSCMVRRVLPGVGGGSVPDSKRPRRGRRKRRPGNRGGIGDEVPPGKKRRFHNGDSI